MSVKSYEIDMCSGSVLKKLLLFSIPLMCSSILQLLFNAADIVVVGRFAGDNSLAAVGSNTALINLLTNLFIGLSVGANVLAARDYGARHENDLSRTVHTSVCLSIISGLLLSIIGIAGAKQILIWMQTPAEVLDLAVTYLRIYFAGMPAIMLYNFGSALLRAVGDTKRPLYFLIISGIVNVVLNLFFVIVLKMDVAGVALATVISETISAGLIVLCLVHEESGIHLDLKKLRIDRDKFIGILRTGLPAGFQGILFALSNVVIQASVNSFGPDVMAGNSAAANVEGFVYMSMNAFYQSAISFVSQNMGARNFRRINRILFTAQICVAFTGLVLGNLVVVFGKPLLGIYSSGDAVIAAGMERFRIIARTYALCGIMDVMVGALRGIGYSVMPMIVSLIGVCVLRLVWLGTVFQIPEYHTARVIYDSYPITWIIAIAVHTVCYIWAFGRVKRRYSEQ